MNETLLSLAFFASDFAALDAPNWRDRDAASQRLAKAGAAALPGAEWLRDRSPSAEVRARCRRLGGNDKYPLDEAHADMFPWLSDPTKDRYDASGPAMWEYLREVTTCRSPVDGWLADRIAAVRWARDELNRGVPRHEVHRQLDVMRRHEYDWWRQFHPNGLP